MNLEKLKAPLAKENIAQRIGGGGTKLDYLEGWFVIDQANEIFGYDGWDYYIDDVQVIKEVIDDKTCKALCRATVTVTVGETLRQDVGVVIGSAKNSMDAIDIGLKGAVTDAMKRAFRTFGNQFGNCLYDKEKGGVEKAGSSSTPSSNGMYPTPKATGTLLFNDKIPF
mgnify:CR=1 FL=1